MNTISFNQLPKFTRKIAVVIPEEIHNPDDESYLNSISFKCFCCEDTGWVKDWMIEKIIPDYNAQQDLFVICNRLQSCRKKVRTIIEEKMYDERFDMELLDQLHFLNMENWKNTTINHFENARKTRDGFINSFSR